jgi:predicted kinase
MAGVSGSGKSTVALDVAESLEGVVIRSDAVRKSLAGTGPDARAATDYGRGIYTSEMTERTYEGLLERAASVIGSGRWALLDATYAQKRHRSAVRSWAKKQTLPLVILHCTAPLSILEARLARRTAEAMDLSDADVEIMRRQLSAFEPFGPEEAGSVVAVDTEKPWRVQEIVAECRTQAKRH